MTEIGVLLEDADGSFNGMPNHPAPKNWVARQINRDVFPTDPVLHECLAHDVPRQSRSITCQILNQALTKSQKRKIDVVAPFISGWVDFNPSSDAPLSGFHGNLLVVAKVYGNI